MLYNSDQIQTFLPHRYPFLLVDTIEEIREDGQKITGRKCVSINEPFFQGHFPGKAVMPGVLIVEALAQTGCVLLMQKEENRGRIAYFAGINKMRFRRQVVPGDILLLEAEFTKAKAGICFAQVKASCQGQTVCEGEILCALGERS